VRRILEAAALGIPPHRQNLDLERDDLPEGHNLTRFKDELVKSATEIAHIHSPEPGISDHAAAKKVADAHVAIFANHMTDEERAITGDNPASVEDVRAAGARMFDNR
jgi:hypothetical protein